MKALSKAMQTCGFSVILLIIVLMPPTLLSQDFTPKIQMPIDPVRLVVESEYFSIKMEALISEMGKIARLMEDILEDKEAMELMDISHYFDAKFVPIMAIEAERREELIKRLEDFIRKYPESRVTPLAMLRLAELYFEKSNEEYLAGVEIAVREGGELPMKDYTMTVNVYKEFLEKYPNYPQRDVVMYLAGYTLSEMGIDFEAVMDYFEPLSKMRTSPLAAEAAMRTAEYYFDAGELEKAQSSYDVVLDYPGTPFYSKAMYKLAWTLFRLGEYTSASDYFVESINVSRMEEVQLRDEAVQFLIASVAELGGPAALSPERKRAILTALKFASKNPELFFMMSTADLYMKQGKYPEAYETYSSVVKSFYLDSESIGGAFGMIRALKKIPDIEAMFDKKIWLAETWGTKSEWAARNPEEFKKHADKIETELLKAAKFFHEKAQKGEEDFYDKAAYAYKKFVELFPNSQDSAEANFFLAEIFFVKGQYYPDAYREYKNVVENTAVTVNKYIYDAAWGMVMSADECLKTLTDEKIDRKKEVAESLKAAAYSFERLFPLDERTPRALYKAAKVLEDEGKYEDALRVLLKITEKYFTSDVAPDAVMEITKIYIDTHRYEDAIEWVDKIVEREEIVSEQMRGELLDIASKALFKIAKSREEDEKDRVEAVALYKKVFEKYSEQDVSDDALYNATVLLREKGACKEAIDTAQIIIENYPESELLYKAIFEQGLCYGKLFMFDEALKIYVEIAEKYKGTEEAKNSLLNAAKIAEGLGRWEEAGNLFLEYYKRFGDIHYLFRAAYNFMESGKMGKAVKLFEDFLSKSEKESPETILAMVEIAKMHIKSGREKEGKDALRRVIEVYEKLGEKEKSLAVRYISEAKFILAQDTFEDYVSIKLTLPQKVMAKKLERKAELLKKVERKFLDIAALGDPYYASASLFHIGYAYQSFADALYEAPIPPGFSEEEKMIYQEELREKAFPIEDTAKELHKRNIEKARELGFMNEWVKKSMENVKILDPLYPIETAEDMIAEVKLPTTLAFSEKVEKEEAERRKGEVQLTPTLEGVKEAKTRAVLSFVDVPLFLALEQEMATSSPIKSP